MLQWQTRYPGVIPSGQGFRYCMVQNMSRTTFGYKSSVDMSENSRDHPYPPPNQGHLSSQDGHAIINTMYMLHVPHTVLCTLGLQWQRTRHHVPSLPHSRTHATVNTGQNKECSSLLAGRFAPQES